MLFFSKLFGYGMFALRLPSIIYSVITLVNIYFISKNLNKKIALISIFLFSISPWSIIVSRMTRDYAFDCMIGSFILLISFNLLKKIIDTKGIKEIVYLTLWPSMVYLVMHFYGRGQTKVVVLIPLITLFYAAYFLYSHSAKRQVNAFTAKAQPLFISKTKDSRIHYLLNRISFFVMGLNRYKGMLYLLSIVVVIYFIDYFNFSQGFYYNPFYFDAFFNPAADTPWQWFHNNAINVYFVISLFIFPLIINILKDNKKRHLIIYLYSIFFFSSGLFILKFVSHVNYYPTRYMYFLFPTYCIIFSISIFYFIKFMGRINVLAPIYVMIIFLLFLNPVSIYYATYPLAIYNDKGISNPPIDNIGVGRFEMYSVANYIKEDLGWNENKIFVFGGRYNQFIYLLDYEMEPERCLVRSNTNKPYDVGKNMFVESSYFNYHELEKASYYYDTGYLVTAHMCITDDEKNCIQNLDNHNFVLYNKSFYFVEKIESFKIYMWNQTHY